MSVPQPQIPRGNSKKLANRPIHRLRSVLHDVNFFLQPLCAELNKCFLSKGWVLIANERCGAWYTIPLLEAEKQPYRACYFKSTDGHVHAFSLKRLNLELLVQFLSYPRAVIVDASVRKHMPDSFSRTIPIWCSVLNRIAYRYRQKRGLQQPNVWDHDLYTPSIITRDEHARMLLQIEDHVETLYECEAIVSIDNFLELMTKPLKPSWVTPDQSLMAADQYNDDFHWVICVNASKQSKPRVCWNADFWYTPGAADDEESWSRGVTAHAFWQTADNMPSSANSIDEVDIWLDQTVSNKRSETENTPRGMAVSFDWLGITPKQLAVGSRRAGRPPNCWENFDAVLNVTDTEYPDMQTVPSSKYYLQLPVKEGKRAEIGQWLALGIMFSLLHLQNNRRVLIHCAQGKDRSVAVALAVVLIGARLKFPMEWILKPMDFDDMATKNASTIHSASDEDNSDLHGSSGLKRCLAESLHGNRGRDLLMQWLAEENALHNSFSKATARIALQLIRQERQVAEPSRATMQKLNRFFISPAHNPSSLTKAADTS